MVNLMDLKSALSKVADLSNQERSFEINGTNITLRVLRPNEEIEVQKRAMEALSDDGETNQVTAADYLQRFRMATLSYAIVAIDNLDLRNVKHIETGETLSNGVSIKIPKHEALENVISEWGREMLSSVFKKFGELNEFVESQVEDSIVYEPEVLDKEIERLEERLKELKAKRELKEPDTETNFSKVTEVANSEDAEKVNISPEKVLVEKGHPIQRESAIPSIAPPPAPVKEPSAPENNSARASDGSYHPNLDEEYQREVDEENLRLLKERQERQAQQSPPPSKPESIGGVEVYRMPTQTLDDRTPAKDASKPAASFNPNHSAPSNPNFKMSN